MSRNIFIFSSLLKGYKGTLINLLLVALVFFLVVKPLLKGLRDLAESKGVESTGELSEGIGAVPQIPESRNSGFSCPRTPKKS